MSLGGNALILGITYSCGLDENTFIFIYLGWEFDNTFREVQLWEKK